MATTEELRAALVVLEASCDEDIDLDTQPLVVLARRTLHEALDEIGTLRRIAVDLHWMARRYAEGRSSYATSLFNDHTRTLLRFGIEPNIHGDGTPWARDAMGPGYSALSAEEYAQGGPLHGWQLRVVPEEVARLRTENAALRVQVARDAPIVEMAAILADRYRAEEEARRNWFADPSGPLWEVYRDATERTKTRLSNALRVIRVWDDARRAASGATTMGEG